MRFGAWLLIFLRKEQYRMKIVLAEKPSVAMSLSKVIGANQTEPQGGKRSGEKQIKGF